MFSLFSKLLSFLVKPIGLVFLALIVAYNVKNEQNRKRLLLVTLFFLYACSTDIVINELYLRYETTPTNRSTVPVHDVGIVLTGGLMNDEKRPVGNLFLGTHADRFAQALLLYKEGKIGKILISGGNVPLMGRPLANEGTLAARFLIKCGVVPADIVLEPKAVNTYENAKFTAQIVQRRFPGQKLLLISSASHLPRAVACFQKQHVEVTAYGADYVAHERQFLVTYLLPSELVLDRARALLHEWLGFAVYKVMGYC